MDRVDIEYARQHLAELMDRASKGEDIEIVDPVRGRFQLKAAGNDDGIDHPTGPVILGQWAGRFVVPGRLFEPLSDEEMSWLSGESAP